MWNKSCFPLWLCFSRHYYLDKRWELATLWAFLCSFDLVHLKVEYSPVGKSIWANSFKARLQMQSEPKWKFRNFWVKFSGLSLFVFGFLIKHHGYHSNSTLSVRKKIGIVLVNIPLQVHSWGFFGCNSMEKDGKPLKHKNSNLRPMRQTELLPGFVRPAWKKYY